MRIKAGQPNRGIALIIVMLVIVTLSMLAGGFAYSMKVETKLARNSSYESEMEWLGRSGVELGKYVLGQQLAIPNESTFACLMQKWAGGPGGTNELLADIHLDNNELGMGRFSVKIVDMERKFNLMAINELNTFIMDKALDLIGVDAGDHSTIIDSFLDWTDPDNKRRLHGAESDDYSHLDPDNPYFAKNGRIDDITELLLVNGVTPEIFWGAGRTGVSASRPPQRGGRRGPSLAQGNNLRGTSSLGLADLFAPVSGSPNGAINVNTATSEVLQLIPGIDPGLAQGIIELRSGPNHQDGDEDDTPIERPGELINVQGMTPQILQAAGRFFGVQSFVFEITVDAQIGNHKRRFVALVTRRSRQEVNTVYFHWK